MPPREKEDWIKINRPVTGRRCSHVCLLCTVYTDVKAKHLCGLSVFLTLHCRTPHRATEETKKTDLTRRWIIYVNTTYLHLSQGFEAPQITQVSGTWPDSRYHEKHPPQHDLQTLHRLCTNFFCYCIHIFFCCCADEYEWATENRRSTHKPIIRWMCHVDQPRAA